MFSLPLAGLACGGDDDGESDGSSNGSYEAANLVPDLSTLGYTTLEEGRDRIAPDELDMHRALYGKSAATADSVIVIAFVQDDEEGATGQFTQVANAYRNMPAAALLSSPLGAGGVSGQPAVNREVGDGPDIGDEHQWFRTAQADSQGNHVWSDIYRQGRAVVVVQVLSGDEEAASETRRSVAEAALAAAD